jgi:hypothetical protein
MVCSLESSRPIAEKQRRKPTNGRGKSYNRNSENYLELVSFLKGASRSYLFFSLKGQPKNLKAICAFQKVLM